MLKTLPVQARLLIYAVLAIITLMIILTINPVVKIEATERGLIKTWGKLDQTVLTPGLHFRLPIAQQVEHVTIQPLQLNHDVAVGADGAITKDNQTIGANLTVFYTYDQARLVEMYQQYGEDKTRSIITSTLRESFKSVIGNYDIFKLPVSQAEIQGKVFEDLKAKLANYPITLNELKVMNYDWSDQFDTQIANTMQKAQEVKQKEQELLIAEQEAQKQVKQAQAEKTATVTKAEGARDAAKLAAEAKALEGEGIKKYNESVATKWDIEVKKLELEIARIKAEKWNGVYVPNNMYGPIPVDTVGGIKQ